MLCGKREAAGRPLLAGMGGNAEKQTPFLRYVDEFVGLSSAPTM